MKISHIIKDPFIMAYNKGKALWFSLRNTIKYSSIMGTFIKATFMVKELSFIKMQINIMVYFIVEKDRVMDSINIIMGICIRESGLMISKMIFTVISNSCLVLNIKDTLRMVNSMVKEN